MSVCIAASGTNDDGAIRSVLNPHVPTMHLIRHTKGYAIFNSVTLSNRFFNKQLLNRYSFLLIHFRSHQVRFALVFLTNGDNGKMMNNGNYSNYHLKFFMFVIKSKVKNFINFIHKSSFQIIFIPISRFEII